MIDVADVRASAPLASPRRLPRYGDDNIRTYTRYDDPPPNVRPAVRRGVASARSQNGEGGGGADLRRRYLYEEEEWQEEERSEC